MSRLEKRSPCKVNLLLNILGKRPDGFHELETVIHPIPLFDRLILEQTPSGIQLTCNEPSLPIDSKNLVFRAAERFLAETHAQAGVRIHLEKQIPLAAGLGGGSGNAATTLSALNELFGHPLSADQLQTLAASLGSDVPFFLQEGPALGTGRGERIQPLGSFPALRGAAFILIHPGFGVPTAWAYQNLGRFPDASNGQAGRAERLLKALGSTDLSAAAQQFYNSLEAPVLHKYPILALFQQFLRANGAAGALMSGSGSTTFAVCENVSAAEGLVAKFKQKFGLTNWVTIAQIGER